MNTCPVYRRTSGISYEATYMGPIGLALEPSYDLYKYAQLPYSCTHCGSCGNVCPVKIPVPELILYWRNEVVNKGYGLFTHNVEEAVAEQVLKNSTNLAFAEKFGLWALRNIPKSIAESGINPWAEEHANPSPPAETFREYYAREIAPHKKPSAKEAGEKK